MRLLILLRPRGRVVHFSCHMPTPRHAGTGMAPERARRRARGPNPGALEAGPYRRSRDDSQLSNAARRKRYVPGCASPFWASVEPGPITTGISSSPRPVPK